MPTSIDIRQSETRILQDQLNLTATEGMDLTLASINSELTPPGRLIAAPTPSLVVTVGSGDIVNPNTSKNRVLAPIGNTVVNFTGGTITFPAGSGTIVVSPGTNAPITIGANQFVAVLVQLNSSGQLSVLVGVPAASAILAVVPSGVPSSLSLGYVIVQSNGSSVIQNVTDGMLYQFVGAGGSGGGGTGSGAKNYLTSIITSTSSGVANPGNGNFETGSTAGWSLAHSVLTSLFPSSVATPGTAFSATSGGSPASGNLSFSTVAGGSQIDGSYSGSLNSTAASVAGDMLISNAFFIDAVDEAKVLGFSFSYKVASGTGLNFSGTASNTFAVYIYDVTNGAWIQPAGVYNLVQGSGSGLCSGTFQTTSNSTKYQIALINVNGSSGAYDLYVDDFSIGPQVVAYGYSAASPGYAGFLQDYAGGVVPPGWALADNSAVSRTQYPDLFTNIGTTWGVGDGITTFNLPDFRRRAAIGSGGTGTGTIGSTVGNVGGEETHTLTASENGDHKHYMASNAAVNSVPTNTTQMAVNQGFGQIQNNNTVAALTLTSFQTTPGGNPHNNMQPSAVVTKLVKLYDDVTVQVSSSTDTRVIAFNATTPNGTPTTSYQTLIFQTVNLDTHSAYSGGTYTVPVSGDYFVFAQLDLNGSISTNAGGLVSILHNGSGVITGQQYAPGNVEISPNCSIIIPCNAGDTITVQAKYIGTIAGPTWSSVNTAFSINRLSGPAAIAASESVALQYNDNSGAAITSTPAVFKYLNRQLDTHGAYNTATGTWTCPVSGTYQINTQITTGTTLSTGGINNLVIEARLNGGGTFWSPYHTTYTPASTNIAPQANGSQCFHFNAGDTVQFFVSVSAALPPTVAAANSPSNNLSIVRTGN